MEAGGGPSRQPRESVRNGTAKALTLSHPATGRVEVEGATSTTDPVPHAWLKRGLTGVLAGLPVPEPVPPGESCRAAVAGGPDVADHAAGRVAAPADALGAGQPGRAQDAGVRLLAVRARGGALVHALGRELAKSDRKR